MYFMQRLPQITANLLKSAGDVDQVIKGNCIMAAPEINNIWTQLGKIDPHCFACGFDNEHGLDMVFETNGSKLRSRVEVPSHLRGWSNLVHGGIISTMIDEAMSWTAIHLLKKLILTKSMKVEFKKPVKIGTPIIIYGFIVEEKNERAATMAAEIYDEEGDLCARGEGEFALFTMEQFAKMGVVSDDQLNEMAEMVEGTLKY